MRIAHLIARLRNYQSRRETRRQLRFLDDRQLADIGVSKIDARHEGRKPFWRS